MWPCTPVPPVLGPKGDCAAEIRIRKCLCPRGGHVLERAIVIFRPFPIGLWISRVDKDLPGQKSPIENPCSTRFPFWGTLELIKSPSSPLLSALLFNRLTAQYFLHRDLCLPMVASHLVLSQYLTFVPGLQPLLLGCTSFTRPLMEILGLKLGAPTWA